MTATTFTPLEDATLQSLWDNEPEWWHFLYILSDRFQDDGDDDGARFIRWLCGIEQRPSKELNWSPDHKWWWWTTNPEDLALKWMKDSRYLSCNLPFSFVPVCYGSDFARLKAGLPMDEPLYGTGVEALEAAMGIWRTFTEEQKQTTEREWRTAQ